MNVHLKQKLKKSLLITSIFLSLLSILFSFLFFDFFKIETIKNVIETLVESSHFTSEYKNITNITDKKNPNTLVFPFVLQGSCNGKHIDIYIVRLNGKYGMHLGLFLYDTDKREAIFSGLVVYDSLQNTNNYGINKGTIEHWKEKIKACYHTPR